jgi:hypothetical protein
MAQSVAANVFRPTVPDSSEQAFMQAALNDGDITALLRGHDRDAKLAALACLYGGPVTEKVAPFANALTRIRERWLARHGRPDAIDAIMCRHLLNAIRLAGPQRDLMDFLVSGTIYETTRRQIVRTVSAIRLCANLVQYQEFDQAWHCVTQEGEPHSDFAAKLNAAMADYVGLLQGMARADAVVQFRDAVCVQLRNGISRGLHDRCMAVMDIDRKITSACRTVLETREVLMALDHTWSGESEPPFDFKFSFGQGMSGERDGVEATVFRAAMRKHLVAALPAQFGDEYARASGIEPEAERQAAVLRLVKAWLDDRSLWSSH